MLFSGVMAIPAWGGFFTVQWDNAQAFRSTPEVRGDVVEVWGGTGPWYVIAVVEAFHASGTFDLAIEWDAGSPHHLEPWSRQAHRQVMIDEIWVDPHSIWTKDFTAAGLPSMHLVVECDYGNPRGGDLQVAFGRDSPYHEAFIMQENDHEYSNLTSSVGWWTFGDSLVHAEVRNGSPQGVPVTVLRSSTNITSVLETGIPAKIAYAGANSHTCAHSGTTPGPG